MLTHVTRIVDKSKNLVEF